MHGAETEPEAVTEPGTGSHAERGTCRAGGRASAVTDARQVRTAFEALVNEGYLYSTIDEHYKATA